MNMAKRNRQRKLQDKLYNKLVAMGYTDNDKVNFLRPDGYHYTLLDIKQYLIFGIEAIND